jgi:hypothetical protein
MATSRHTSGRRGQKLNTHHVSALQGKLLMPNKEEDSHTRCYLFVFLFHLVLISPFTTNVI